MYTCIIPIGTTVLALLAHTGKNINIYIVNVACIIETNKVNVKYLKHNYFKSYGV